MKTFPSTALEVSYCPPHLIKIEMVNVSKNGKPVIHQIGRCVKCDVIKDYGGLEEKRVAYFKEAGSKGGRNSKKKKDIWK